GRAGGEPVEGGSGARPVAVPAEARALVSAWRFGSRVVGSTRAAGADRGELRERLFLGFGGAACAGAVGRVPGIPHLIRPALVVRPGVQVAGDGGLAGTRALHAIQPVCIRVGPWRGAVRGNRRVALRPGRVVSPPVARAHVKLLIDTPRSVRRWLCA